MISILLSVVVYRKAGACSVGGRHKALIAKFGEIIDILGILHIGPGFCFCRDCRPNL